MSYKVKKDIYIIKNIVNNKVYIGQSVDAYRRFQSHKSNAKHLYKPSVIDEAMASIGINNFYYEIIEKTEFYNEREKYWIEYYNSVIPNGYNTLKGGCGASPIHASIKEEQQLYDIINDILYTDDSLIRIAEKYKVNYKLISAINRGLVYKRDFDYPLRKRDNDKITLQVIDNIIFKIENSSYSLRQIAEQEKVNHSLVCDINKGKIVGSVKKEYYPLRIKQRPDYVNKIIDLLLNTNKSFRQIAKELKVNYTVVQSINQGKTYYNNNIQYPIRQNKN